MKLVITGQDETMLEWDDLSINSIDYDCERSKMICSKGL
jgi:hypothetical protein